MSNSRTRTEFSLLSQKDDVTTLQDVDHKAGVIFDKGGRGGSGRGGSSVGVVNEGSTFIRSGGGRAAGIVREAVTEKSAAIPAFAAENWKLNTRVGAPLKCTASVTNVSSWEVITILYFASTLLVSWRQRPSPPPF